MTFGYIRVSSDRQTVENQRFEIEQFCTREGIAVDGWIEETVSGTKAYSKRRLGKLLKHVGKGDLIICSELSRLGRSLYMIMEILSYCMRRECAVWTIKDGYRLGDDIQSKVLALDAILINISKMIFDIVELPKKCRNLNEFCVNTCVFQNFVVLRHALMNKESSEGTVARLCE